MGGGGKDCRATHWVVLQWCGTSSCEHLPAGLAETRETMISRSMTHLFTRRMRLLACAAALTVAALLALCGCGASSLSTPTTTFPQATIVGPQTFLNDSAAATAALRDFVNALSGNGPTLSSAQAKAISPLLDAALGRAQLERARLSQEHIDDARLEAQRQAVIGPFGAVVSEMVTITGFAHSGNAVALTHQLGTLRTQLAALSQAGL
jgi:hypothetical protein